MTRPNKFMFNIKMLALAFELDRTKVSSMISNINPIERKGNSLLYDIKDVAKLIETRESMIVERHKNHRFKDNYNSHSGSEEDEIITDPEEMNSLQKINFYKAEDLRQSAMLKQHKNDLESGKLMVATEVERTTAEAFKKIALVLDTLPDLLERDGIIGSGDIEKVINVLDNSRQQLAIDLSEISPVTNVINKNGDW